jgi:hypothetical protein
VINGVYLVILFLSVILPMLLLSSKLKRNLIIAQNSINSWMTALQLPLLSLVSCCVKSELIVG